MSGQGNYHGNYRRFLHMNKETLSVKGATLRRALDVIDDDEATENWRRATLAHLVRSSSWARESPYPSSICCASMSIRRRPCASAPNPRPLRFHARAHESVVAFSDSASCQPQHHHPHGSTYQDRLHAAVLCWSATAHQCCTFSPWACILHYILPNIHAPSSQQRNKKRPAAIELAKYTAGDAISYASKPPGGAAASKYI